MPFTEFKKVEYPDELLPKTWSKKKSILSAGVETGVGEAMKECKAAYDKVDWDKLQLSHHFHGNNFNIEEWKSRLGEARGEAYGALMDWSLALDKVRDKALEAEKTFTKRKTSPKSDVKLAKEVADIADVLAGKMNKNVVTPILIAIHDDNKNKMEEVVLTLKTTLKKNLVIFGNAIKAIKTAKEEDKVTTFNTKQGEARKVTQVFGNVSRYKKMGFDPPIDEKKANDLFDEMEDWANCRIELPAVGYEEQLEKELEKMKDCLKRATVLAG